MLQRHYKIRWLYYYKMCLLQSNFCIIIQLQHVNNAGLVLNVVMHNLHIVTVSSRTMQQCTTGHIILKCASYSVMA